MNGFKKTLTTRFGHERRAKRRNGEENEKNRQKSPAGSVFFDRHCDGLGRRTNINRTPAASRNRELRESIIKKGENDRNRVKTANFPKISKIGEMIRKEVITRPLPPPLRRYAIGRTIRNQRDRAGGLGKRTTALFSVPRSLRQLLIRNFMEEKTEKFIL